MELEIALAGVDILAAEEGEGEAGEESEEVVNPVIPDGSEMVYAAIFFAALWALMRYVLLPPVLKLRSEREEKMNADREAADRARATLGQVQMEYDAALAEARATADGIIDEARVEAAEYRATVLGEATEEISALRSDAATGLHESRVAAIDGMRGDVGEIAVSAASAVLGRPVDPASAQAAIDEALDGGDDS